jgi:hypothetical protein
MRASNSTFSSGSLPSDSSSSDSSRLGPACTKTVRGFLTIDFLGTGGHLPPDMDTTGS